MRIKNVRNANKSFEQWGKMFFLGAPGTCWMFTMRTHKSFVDELWRDALAVSGCSQCEHIHFLWWSAERCSGGLWMFAMRTYCGRLRMFLEGEGVERCSQCEHYVSGNKYLGAGTQTNHCSQCEQQRGTWSWRIRMFAMRTKMRSLIVKGEDVRNANHNVPK